MNKSQLAYELHRYLFARLDREPPAPPEDLSVSREEENTMTANSQSSEKEIDQRQSELDQLVEQAHDCSKCKLSENRTNVVFGQGGVEARVMVVGEGPGADEDEQGEPFVGRSGKLLRQSFEKVGLVDADLYITNVVKCRPPDNRDPHREELSACEPYLDYQLDLIKPGVILSLGNFAFQYFVDSDQGIMSARGDTYELDEYTLVPTFHPSHMLYHPSKEKAEQFVTDLKLAVDQLNG